MILTIRPRVAWEIGKCLRDQSILGRRDAVKAILELLNYRDCRSFIRAIIEPSERDEFYTYIFRIACREVPGCAFRVKCREHMGLRMTDEEILSHCLDGGAWADSYKLRDELDLVIPFAAYTVERYEHTCVVPIYCYGYDGVMGVCAQQKPNNFSELAYQVYKDAVHAQARHFLAFNVGDGGHRSAAECQGALRDKWGVYVRFIRMVAAIFGYVDRYYVHHNTLPSLTTTAMTAGKDVVMEHWQSYGETEEDVRRAVETLQETSELELSDEQLEVPWVNLQTRDGTTVATISWQAAKVSKYISQCALLEANNTHAMHTKPQPPNVKVDLPAHINITSTNLLERVAGFLEHQAMDPVRDMPKPLQSSDMHTLVQPWFAKFITEIDQETLFELILAANKLHIPPLLDLACAQVAAMIKGKTPEEIRRTFNITNDFTPEEEAEVREENKWLEEA